MTTTEFLLIATHSAPKASRHGDGFITFHVLRDTANNLYLMLAGNDRAGYFSREPVALERIQQCINGLKADQPVFAKVFRSAFITGRSANNPGFLASCLRHLGLLGGMSGATHRHQLSGDWSAWQTSMRDAPAEPFILPTAPSESTMEKPSSLTRDNAQPLPEKHSRKGKKSFAERRELTTHTEEDHACAA